MIRFEQVSKAYAGGKQALDNVSFHLEQGSMAFLTGHSGAGKSTLLKLITLIERPTHGSCFIGGQNLASITRKEIPYFRRKIGMIFQDHKLLMDRTVFDNVALPMIIEGFSNKQIAIEVDRALEQVGLEGKQQLKPDMLSGGEQQRVGIARAIINNPPLVLADEPTGNLDPMLSMDILKLFESLNDNGTSIFIASHDLGLISRMKHDIYTLKHGRLTIP